MNVGSAVLDSASELAPTWGSSWMWGVPLIVLTVVIHAIGLGLMGQRINGVIARAARHPNRSIWFAGIVGTVTCLATVLHAIEAIVWALAYRVLHALPNAKSGMLYSLNAMTSYGHTGIDLNDHWRLMGALEALSGWLLFGLSTAFMFSVIQRFGLVELREGRRNR